MFGLGKNALPKEGDFIFARQPDGEYNKIILVQLLAFRVQKLELMEL